MSNDIFSYIREELDALEASLLKAVKTPLPLITDVGTHIVLSGGKRLRPALCILSAQCGEKYNFSHVMPLAVAVEMVHMASLIHDDVLDAADTRRGRETVNYRWGNKIAILSGDHMFAQAFQTVSDEHYDEAVALRMAQLICGLSSGEIIQDAGVFDDDIDADDYYQRIEKKTAEFLAVCCELGAMISGADQQLVKALHDYGYSLGMAFQITDDLLDITGATSVIGKPAGNDIRQGVITLPVIRALASSPDAEELRKIITDPLMDDVMLERALEIVKESDGVDFSRQQADHFLGDAKKALQGIIDDKLLSEFVKIADFIAERKY